MTIKQRILLIFLSLSLSFFSLHASNSYLKLSINTLIQKVKHSKGDQRRKAMNALKQKLRSANKQTREKVIAALRQRFVKQPTTLSTQQATPTTSTGTISLSPSSSSITTTTTVAPSIPTSQPVVPRYDTPTTLPHQSPTRQVQPPTIPIRQGGAR